MNIKHAIIGIAALMLVPVAAFAQPAITPAPGTASIVVYNSFDDGNMEDSVEVVLECTSGTYAPDSSLLEQNGVHIFSVAGIADGFPNLCTVKTSGLDGYGSESVCADGGGVVDSFPDVDCDIDEQNDYCQFNDVQEGAVGICEVLNTPLPVDVEVTKVWEISGAGGINFDRDTQIVVECDAEIVGGSDYGSYWRRYFNLYDPSSYEDEEGDDIGMGTITAKVIPEWYPTAADPDDQEYTECEARETGNDSAVEVESDCDAVEVAVGMGGECTITNTVFFEGIPTLNQYGMAIMALLMLGVGFVGFRRFV